MTAMATEATMTKITAESNFDADVLLAYASAIVAAYVSKNPIPVSDIPVMIRSVHSGLVGASGGATPDQPVTLKPAVPVKRSITPDHIVCLEDGKKLKMLKRHLRTRFKMTPDEYRAKWGLPHDYPMVAPNYSERRSQFAKEFGLGKTRAPAKRRRRA
jgi:predicted transcriptional regulator